MSEVLSPGYGGGARQGYTISGMRSERVIDGNMRVTQFSERAMFESHPEFAHAQKDHVTQAR
jgi:hypothetical protein